MNFTNKAILIQCFPGNEPWLEKEIKTLGYDIVNIAKLGVWIDGDYSDCIRLNYHLRTANRILYRLEEFTAKNADALYKEVLKIPWETIIPNDGYFSIHGYVRTDTIRDNRFAFMRMKDGVADRMKEKTGHRPDAGKENDKTVLYLHWINEVVTIYIDTSGETLTKHGYRKMPGKAPMNESLAAAVIYAMDWNMETSFVNPMCGSGTLAIEAALMLKNIYPGKFRSNYGFMHTLLYDKADYDKVCSEQHESNREIPKIIASDHNSEAIKAARTNAAAAGVSDIISFSQNDFTKTELPEGPGVIILNPEYGERMGEISALASTYTAIGDFFKAKAAGKMGYIFTGNSDLSKKVGLRTKRRIEFYNARIECRLLEYELYQGSRKH